MKIYKNNYKRTFFVFDSIQGMIETCISDIKKGDLVAIYDGDDQINIDNKYFFKVIDNVNCTDNGILYIEIED